MSHLCAWDVWDVWCVDLRPGLTLGGQAEGRGGKAIHVGPGFLVCVSAWRWMGELYSWVLGLGRFFLAFFLCKAGERMRSGDCRLKLAMMVDIMVYMMISDITIVCRHEHTQDRNMNDNSEKKSKQSPFSRPVSLPAESMKSDPTLLKTAPFWTVSHKKRTHA